MCVSFGEYNQGLGVWGQGGQTGTHFICTSSITTSTHVSMRDVCVHCPSFLCLNSNPFKPV